jgi:hypothetical protein
MCMVSILLDLNLGLGLRGGCSLRARDKRSGAGELRERTESVHLNKPRNIRVSVVVTRRVLLRREVR